VHPTPPNVNEGGGTWPGKKRAGVVATEERRGQIEDIAVHQP
jgi:hypothetical protein